MCLPLAAVAAIAAVAGTGMSLIAQSQAAKAQTKAIKAQNETAQEESRRKASGEMFDAMRATRREQGRIRAAAGEAGLSTTSGNVEALLVDSAMQGGLTQERVLANHESRTNNINAETASQLSRIQKPTALGAGLQLALSATNAYIGAGGKFTGPNPMGA